MSQINPPEVPQDDIPQTISINGVDYDPTEAQSLIELGKKTSDLEKQWNTPVDNVWPEYGKTRESLKSMEAELTQARTKLQEFESKQTAGTETQADRQQAREAAKTLGIVLDDDLKSGGYIRKEELPDLFRSFNEEQREVQKILDTGDSLEKEIDGKDGRPAFNKKVVIAYANAYGIPDLTQAYEDMYKAQLDTWKSNQVTSQKSQGLKTLSTGGTKQVKEVKVTDDNVNEMLRESLYGSDN